MKRLLIVVSLATFMWSCDASSTGRTLTGPTLTSSPPTSPSPTSPPPTQPARRTYTLSGVVSEVTANGVAPVGDVRIEAWVCDGPNCAIYLDLVTLSDSDGRYSIPGLWVGLETGLWVTKAGYDVAGPRPSSPCDGCVRLFTASGDTQLDISLIRR